MVKPLSISNVLIRRAFLVLGILYVVQTHAQPKASKNWVADLGNGTYKNPVLHADYSDPDACGVNGDFYMTASSFNCVPGLPILHSKDLVNWKLINYALKDLSYADGFDVPQHGKGVWAPCIRYHQNQFYIFFPDPDHGIYVVKASDPSQSWSEPVLVKEGKGLIDPSPLWDDDGRAYLTYAFAGSRAGIKSLLMICSLNEDGMKAFNDDQIIFDGHDEHPTVEGPKIYKRKGWYYIFAPAGGVATGWQLALRAKVPTGPYEARIVMSQGKSEINGPHQGAWVQLANGEDWFLHFQDKGVHGRVVHLQPMKWVSDWPVIGVDKDGDGSGEPVLSFKKPGVDKSHPVETPVESDEFNQDKLGLQWQWHANPQPYWAYINSNAGFLRLFSHPLPDGFKNFWTVPNLLLQKIPAPEFQVTTRITFSPKFEGERVGLMVMGLDYGYISAKKVNTDLFIDQTICKNANSGSPESTSAPVRLSGKTFYLRLQFRKDAMCEFAYSEDGNIFKSLGTSFKAREGTWIGAKVGLFCVRGFKTNDAGYADIGWFRVEPIN